jgi:hypothetical protein
VSIIGAAGAGAGLAGFLAVGLVDAAFVETGFVAGAFRGVSAGSVLFALAMVNLR